MFGPNLLRKGATEQNNQSNKLQAFAFCVVNVNETIVFKHFEDFKNLILNFLKEKLVISCLLDSFYLYPLQEGPGKKVPYHFFPLTSTNIEISSINFPTLNFFVTLV